jgi:WD40 repeat protein
MGITDGLRVFSRIREKRQRLKSHSTDVTDIAVTCDGRRAVSVSLTGTVLLWDVGSGQIVQRTDLAQTGLPLLFCVAVTHDERAVLGWSNGNLCIWSLNAGKTEFPLAVHKGAVLRVKVTPDGHRAVSASTDGTLCVWDLKSGKLVRVLKGHTASVGDLSITPDGFRAVSASRDKTLRIWDLESGQTLSVLEGHTDRVSAVAIDAKGSLAVSGSPDKTVRIWDLRTGSIVRTLQIGPDGVHAIALTPDGRRAVLASGLRTVVWDLPSGNQIAAFTGENLVLSCAIAPDGRTFIAGAVVGVVHFLRLVEADQQDFR